MTTSLTADYTPLAWTRDQAAIHVADTLEEAFHHASCLAGGWYRRSVTIDMQVTEDNHERYIIRPSDIAALPGWAPCYAIQRVTS